jgi:carboxymethylenebutenolidase
VDIREYLAEEIALDHTDGLLSRRDALRALVLMGFTTAAASALLGACGGGTTPARTAASPTPRGPGPVGRPQPVSFPGSSGALRGAWAPASSPRGAVLVIHENQGLSPFIESVTVRLAAAGWSALAPDLLSEEGGTASFGDPARATAALSRVPPGRFVADLRAAVDELQRRQPRSRPAAIGFCFGGGLLWSLLAAGEPRLAAAVPFYGPCPATPDFSRSHAAVLAVYAGLDTRVNATRDRCVAALHASGATVAVRTYPGADHAFMNDTGARYDAAAATQAEGAMLDWLRAHA